MKHFCSAALPCTVLVLLTLLLAVPTPAPVVADDFKSPARRATTEIPQVTPRHRERSPKGADPRLPKSTDPLPPSPVFDTRQLEGVGTMLLEDVMRLVRQSPRLADEVGTALREINKTAKDITCIGKRIDGRWRHLAGARTQPYTCRFGERWLELSAEVRIRGKRGEGYERVSDVAIKNARVIRETNPRWSWTTVKPRGWFLE